MVVATQPQGIVSDNKGGSLNALLEILVECLGLSDR